MSNVTPEEIVAQTALAFSIPTPWLKESHRFRLLIPAAARRVATYLLRRHTSLTWAAICREVGIAPGGFQTSIKVDATEMPKLMEEMPELAAIVEQCEAVIDDIHERREAAQAAYDAGAAALAGIPPLTQEALDKAFEGAGVRS